jgi:tRNA (guanosine-2'-O-)-methyltransferase
VGSGGIDKPRFFCDFVERMRRKSKQVCEPERGAPWPPPWTAAGVIEALQPLAADERKSRLSSVIAARLESVTVVLDAPHDPHNGAAVLRTCDAFGVQNLHVVPGTEPFVIATTVTRGSEKWVDVVPHASPGEAARALVEAGFELVATRPDGELVPEDLAAVKKLALIVGNERDGIREELSRAARRAVRVPMRGFVESLNLSVSTAILLAQATRGRPGDLSPLQKQALYARGLFRSVVRADDVLSALDPR